MYTYCYVHVLLLLCMFRSVYSVHCVVVCTVCVQMCTVLLPPGVNPVAVNKYLSSKAFMSERLPNLCLLNFDHCMYRPVET